MAGGNIFCLWLMDTVPVLLFFFFLMIRRPPRSTLFPTRRSSDLIVLTPAERAEIEVADFGLGRLRSEEHTSELQSRQYLVCRLLLEKKKNTYDVCHIALDIIFHKQASLFGQFSFAGNFFFNDTATTEIYTLSLHDALPI